MANSDTGKKRILVVEDEPAINRVFQRVLSNKGFEIETVMNGIVAQTILEQNDYELIFLDMRTPGMSSNELYGWLKDKFPQKAKRVIFSTGDVMNSETQGFLVSTGRPCLAKPFTPDELRTSVKETLRRIKNERKEG